MNDINFTPGMLVRVSNWIGVVLDVFQSSTSNQKVVKINFVKNVYKQQPPELHIVEDIQPILSVATIEDFNSEIERYERMKEKELAALREKLTVAA